ncbi:MAG: hypothetical protein JEZ03_07670 [Bacteroidales bacterium]|nr:hypothetical protein [Bacteroidales bacterium]
MVFSWFLLGVNVSFIVLIIAAILGLLQVGKSDTATRVLVGYLILTLIVEVIAKVLILNGKQNLPLLHLYTLFEFMLFSIFYVHILNIKRTIKKYVFPFLGIVSVLIVINSLFLQSVTEFNTNAKVFVGIIICLYSIVYFQQQLSVRGNKSLNLINSGVLIYFSGSLMVFITGGVINYLSMESAYLIWGLNLILSIIFYLIISYALCLNLLRKIK